uniref:Uncharacterized protein n=1 Tax=Anguilla anguilla TaxID=7936 RepID=A0A0E9RY42_ANGAN
MLEVLVNQVLSVYATLVYQTVLKALDTPQCSDDFF